jgi:hypothetical protein
MISHESDDVARRKRDESVLLATTIALYKKFGRNESPITYDTMFPNVDRRTPVAYDRTRLIGVREQLVVLHANRCAEIERRLLPADALLFDEGFATEDVVRAVEMAQ